jgi:hypothetical protein
MYSSGLGEPGSPLGQKPPMSWLQKGMPDRLRLRPARSADAMPSKVEGVSPSLRG